MSSCAKSGSTSSLLRFLQSHSTLKEPQLQSQSPGSVLTVHRGEPGKFSLTGNKGFFSVLGITNCLLVPKFRKDRCLWKAQLWCAVLSANHSEVSLWPIMNIKKTVPSSYTQNYKGSQCYWARNPDLSNSKAIDYQVLYQGSA